MDAEGPNENGQAANGSFSCSQGKTYLHKKNGQRIRIFEFILTKLAAVSDTENLAEGYSDQWIFELKNKRETDDSYKSQFIALGGDSFISRKSFSNSLSPQSNCFIHVPAVVNADILSAYLEFLQEEYVSGNPSSLTVADIIAMYDCGTLVLSNEIQIKDQLLVPDIKRKFVVLNNLRNGDLQMDPPLLNVAPLLTTFSKFLDYSIGFGPNRIGFLQAVSFTMMRILKSKIKEAAADKAKYCLIYSADKSVGKTKSLWLIGKGKGMADPLDHLLSVAGGDGFLSGMSCKLQQQAFASNNLVAILNEIKMSSTIANSLNQCHDGFCSGSLKAGIVKPRASIIGSSNSKEHEALEGRMVRITYRSGQFTDEMERLLGTRLEPLVEENKGFLLAWCLKFEDCWSFIDSIIKYPLHAIVKEKLPQRQSRYTWAITGNLIVFYLLFVTTGKKCDPDEIFRNVVCGDELEEQSFTERFGTNLLEMAKSSSEIFTWFNPCTSFTDKKKNNHPSFAIRSTSLTKLTDISFQEFEQFIEKYEKNAWQQTCRFCKDPLSKFEDNNKPGKVKEERAYKIPWSALQGNLATELRKELGMPYDEPVTDETERKDRRVQTVFDRIQSIYDEFYGLEDIERNSTTESDDEVLEGREFDSGPSSTRRKIEITERETPDEGSDSSDV